MQPFAHKIQILIASLFGIGVLFNAPALGQSARETIDADRALELTLLGCAAGLSDCGNHLSTSDAQTVLGFNSTQEARDYLDALQNPDVLFEKQEVLEAGNGASDAENTLEFERGEGTAVGDLPGSTSLSGEVEPSEQQMLACAAGLAGCGQLTPNEMRVVLGYTDKEEAKQTYDARYGETTETTDEMNFDLSEGMGGDLATEGPDDLNPRDNRDDRNSAGRETGFAALDGYTSSPCPGTLYEAPKFMGNPTAGVALCAVMYGDTRETCGLPAANSFCLTEGHRQAACFGVETSGFALHLNAMCSNCPAFSFIVCR